MIEQTATPESHYQVFPAYELKDRELPLNALTMQGLQSIAPAYFAHPATHVQQLEHVYVSPYGVVYKQHKVIAASLGDYNMGLNHHKTYVKKRLLRRVKKVEGLCVVVTNPFFDNYYHFCVECLPRLLAVYDRRAEVQVIVPETAPHFFSAYLSLLGFSKMVMLPLDELLHARHLLVPGQTTRVHKQNPAAMNRLSDLLNSAAAPLQPSFSGYSRVFVNRNKARYRKIVNQEAVNKLLHDYGFQFVDFEDYTLQETIAMMSQTKVLVGIHGAGLSNMLFMPLGGTVISLVHGGHHDDSFYNLACVRRHASVFLQGQPANSDPRGVCFDDFTINITELSYWLQQVCCTQPACNHSC